MNIRKREEEYVIFDQGKGICGRLHVGKKSHDITLSENNAIAVIIPAFAWHGFQALREISYTVLRKRKLKRVSV